jgi:antirestriction protein
MRLPFGKKAGLSYFKCLSLMKNSKNTPKIYVGTYVMYNSGSFFGKWFDLSDYSDAQEFYKDCYEYHWSESGSSGSRPELMFQDWEYIPSFLISESSLHQGTFKYFEAVF